MRYLCYGLLLVAACKTEHMNTPDAPGPPGPQWWSPKPGEAKNWDVQLVAPIDVSADRTMYDLDLWSLVPSATSLDYGDGDPVAVPAGSLAGTLEQLHARSPKAIVICHVGVGALWLTDPDARKFPGFEANPPDSPTAPKAGSLIGWSYDSSNAYTGTKLRFLDIRSASRALLEKVLWKRFDLAQQIGCDGVEGYAIGDRTDTSSGFTTTADDIFSMYGATARQGHDRKLSTGMRNGDNIPSAPDMGVDKFDWMMLDRCGEYMDCDTARPFISAQKAVFVIEYDHATDGTPQSSVGVCNQESLANIPDGIYKDYPPTKAVRTQCSP